MNGKKSAIFNLWFFCCGDLIDNQLTRLAVTVYRVDLQTFKVKVIYIILTNTKDILLFSGLKYQLHVRECMSIKDQATPKK